MNLLKLNIQLLAHKKGQGSTKNGRDSESKRLGAKAADGEFVTGGSILYQVKMLVSEAMILFMQKFQELLNLNVWEKIVNK